MAASQAQPAHLRIDNAAILRGNRLVLRDFSLEARAGDIVWLRGANGSGKSTLLRALSGLLPLAAGQIDLQGSLALTDDNIALDTDQSLDDALRFWARLDGVGAAQSEAALAALDLVPLAELPLRLLSAGQKRRCALARMIASGAAIWLLDEPYNALDEANVARLDSAISMHAAKGGIAIIASHIAPTINVANSVSLDKRKQAAA
jgi:heme exporter protein A